MSTSFKDRYMNEKERYPTECAFYENIDRQYEKIYQISGKQGNYNGDLSKGLFRSIINAYMYLRTDKDCSGATITIYDLKPHIVRIKNYQTGQFLCSESNDQRSKITLSDDPYDWVIYNNENGTISLISYTSSCAISIDEEEIVGGEILLLPSIGNELQQWIYKEVNDACVFISPDNKVLADVEDSVCIAEGSVKYFSHI